MTGRLHYSTKQPTRVVKTYNTKKTKSLIFPVQCNTYCNSFILFADATSCLFVQITNLLYLSLKSSIFFKRNGTMRMTDLTFSDLHFI